MDISQIFYTSLSVIGGSTALVGIAAWIIRLLIESKLSKNLESHRQTLSKENELYLLSIEHSNTRELESIRGSIQYEISKNSLAYAKVYEKRMEVLETTYKTIVELHGCVNKIVNGPRDQDSISKANDLFNSKAVELGNYFLLNKLYLPEIAAQKIDQMLRDCNYNIWSYQFSLHRQGVFSASGNADLMHKAFADEDIARKFLEKELPVVIGLIEIEFKNSLQIK